MAKKRKEAPAVLPFQSDVADGMMTIPEACAFSKLSRSELYLLMGRGELRYAKHGRRRLVPKRALMNMLSRSLVAA